MTFKISAVAGVEALRDLLSADVGRIHDRDVPTAFAGYVRCVKCGQERWKHTIRRSELPLQLWDLLLKCGGSLFPSTTRAGLRRLTGSFEGAREDALHKGVLSLLQLAPKASFLRRIECLEVLLTERDQAIRTVRTEVADLVVTATEKVIGETLDEHKHRQLIERSIEEVASGDGRR